MSDPEWLTKMRAEGRVKETAANRDALVGRMSVADNDEFMAKVASGMSEADFQYHVVELAQGYGWTVALFRKVRVQRADGSTYWETPVGADGKGWTDLALVKGPWLVFVEIKVDNNQLEPDQILWRDLLLAAGQEWHLWRPTDWPAIRERLER